MRRPLIAGNWKMHGRIAEATALVRALLDADAPSAAPGVEALVCPPFTALAAVGPLLGDQRRFGLGAQNMHERPQGAFTGEISAPMLLELGVRYVILGHSERRTYFGETDASVNLKVKAAFDSGLIPIVAVGETREEHERGAATTVVRRQVRAAFDGVPDARIAGAVVAYEPIWAIGTGLACDPAEADAVMGDIRAALPALAGARVLYGGSVNPENIRGFMSRANVDGALVGGASLDAAAFSALIVRTHEVLQAR